MNPFILEDRTFGLSGEPSQLEYYKCFHDPAHSGPITGEELLELENTPNWNEDKAAVWHYFYRPYNYGRNIGPEQRRNIDLLNLKIDQIEKSLGFNTLSLKLLPFLFLLTAYTIIQYSMNPIFFVFGLLYAYLVIQHLNLKEKLDTYQKARSRYTRELNFLLDQKINIENDRLSSRAVEEIFWENIRRFESSYIEKTFDAIPDEIRADCKKFYSSKLLEDYGNFTFPTFPVIPSWGLLQSSVRNYAGKDQETGLKIIADELKHLHASFSPNGEEKIATWRKVSQGRALFRVWYIQFLIFHDDNLELVSYYYDFVTNKSYSEKVQAFQYKHITDYTYADEDISYMMRDPLIKELRTPDTLTKNIFGNQVKTISLNSASGSNYRCVLPDNDVTNGIDLWIKQQIDKEAALLELQKSTDEELEYWYNELIEIEKDYDGLIETLAWLSFKNIRDKASQALKVC